ncbi:mitochondrial fission factor-like [Thamnophis elegans]|uniref:mitochondrial fission factor-like n=1 Tax=Thamnophis elegans TaxID=35005 RepID=UPI001376F605|nr:mitochondrial fission factor-like [Thamnophis elegans]XP_032083209.1 mitochondrial fission factor-like [Thamnophis elegans]XP_032083210.1 mitochondrial fission factor-like [Thamnophis elegans]
MGSAQLDEANREAEFSEAISRLMQVPSRLDVAADEDFLLSFQMQVPGEPLPAEMKSLYFQPPGAQKQPRPYFDRLFLESALRKPVFGQHKWLSFACQPGPQKNKQLASAETIWEEGMSDEAPQGTVERIRQRESRLEPGLLQPCPSCPAFFGEGRIYSPRNVLRMLRFLGLQLFRLLWGPSARVVNVVSDGSQKEPCTLEIRAMMEQLSDLSRQLGALEEQSGSWHQKELFLYSMLVSAWLFNMWMWLRK